MMNRVGELERTLEVSESDLREIGVLRRQRILEKVVHIALPAVSAVVGLIAGNAFVPLEPTMPSLYPYGPMVAASPAVATSRRRSWVATVVVSAVLFLAAFALIATINTAINDIHGVTTRYGVYDGGRLPGRSGT